MDEKYVDVKGIRTRYLEAGRGECLLLVHAGNFNPQWNANDWDLNIDLFAKSFHVLAPDKIGSGFTDNPKSDKEYVIGTAVQHLYDFLKTMGIDSAHIAGVSRGGYAVCRLALEYPEMVKTLVIIDSVTFTGAVPANPISSGWSRVSSLAPLIKDIRDRYRYIAAANSFGAEHITDEMIDRTVEIVLSPKYQELEAKMKAGLNEQFTKDLEVRQKETHEWIRAGKLKTPTLLMWGYNDPSTAPFDPVGLAAMKLIFPFNPRAEMHILNQAGHYCFREQPEAFVAAVTSFIKLHSGVSQPSLE